MATSPLPPACKLCRSKDVSLVETIRSRPKGETDFRLAPETYHRQIYSCNNCTVYFNHHNLLQEHFYNATYNSGTYQRDLHASYQRIRELPEDSSDNKQRVRRIIAFDSSSGRAPGSVLDIGSGLCVFLAEMKEHAYYCCAIDPDPLSAQHALRVANVDVAHAGVLQDFQPDRQYDIITFNKVLEHVLDPIQLLSLAGSLLAPNGFIYVELPDAPGALQAGTAIDREEFYIEHETVFTNDSMQYLIDAAGLECLEMQAIHEPSDKFTLYAFAHDSASPHLEA